MKYGLLSEVREGGADDGVPAGVARALLARQPVDAAVSRASAARPQLVLCRGQLFGHAASALRQHGRGREGGVVHEKGRGEVEAPALGGGVGVAQQREEAGRR